MAQRLALIAIVLLSYLFFFMLLQYYLGVPTKVRVSKLVITKRIK